MLSMFEKSTTRFNRSPFLWSQKVLRACSSTTIAQRPVLSMPLLNEVALRLKHQVDFKRTAFFGIQHILKTNTPLFYHLIQDLGANPEHIFLSGKGYSDHEETESVLRDQLGIQYLKLSPAYAQNPGRYQEILRAHLRGNWNLFSEHIKNQNIDQIIVFDEGGHCFETMPESLCFKYSMVGIEQTRGGLYSPTLDVLPFPLIEVASSATKRHLEAPFIVEAIINKLKNILSVKNEKINSETIFGIVGNGAIGSQLTQYLLSSGYHVVAFDENTDSFRSSLFKHDKFYRGRDVREVIVRATYIFGCTGKNIIPEGSDYLNTIARDKILVSCTSENKEFQAILKQIKCDISGSMVTSSGSLTSEAELRYTTEAGGTISILNRGFPVNFDHSGESVPTNQIQLTRALMLAAFVQGSKQSQILPGKGRLHIAPRIMLDPFLQQYIAKQFKTYQGDNPLLNQQWKFFENLDWIIRNSGGVFAQNPDLFEHLQTHPGAELRAVLSNSNSP